MPCFENINNCKDTQFRTITGIKRSTFNHMVKILLDEEKIQKARGGRKNKLSMENRLLMTLEYIREYRSQLHVAISFGISESSARKTMRWIENTLVKHPDFALPGRKAPLKSDIEYEVILIDATETPIQRPKKSKENIIQEKRKDIP